LTFKGQPNAASLLRQISVLQRRENMCMSKSVILTRIYTFRDCIGHNVWERYQISPSFLSKFVGIGRLPTIPFWLMLATQFLLNKLHMHLCQKSSVVKKLLGLSLTPNTFTKYALRKNSLNQWCELCIAEKITVCSNFAMQQSYSTAIATAKYFVLNSISRKNDDLLKFRYLQRRFSRYSKTPVWICWKFRLHCGPAPAV
jgi:hypothetical protein